MIKEKEAQQAMNGGTATGRVQLAVGARKGVLDVSDLGSENEARGLARGGERWVAGFWLAFGGSWLED